MICEPYLNLSQLEKYEYVGKVVHLFMCDEETFKLGCELIAKAENEGKLDRMKILPPTQQETNY